MCAAAAAHSFPQAMVGLCCSLNRDSRHNGEAEEQGKVTFGGLLSYGDIFESPRRWEDSSKGFSAPGLSALGNLPGTTKFPMCSRRLCYPCTHSLADVKAMFAQLVENVFFDGYIPFLFLASEVSVRCVVWKLPLP